MKPDFFVENALIEGSPSGLLSYDYTKGVPDKDLDQILILRGLKHQKKIKELQAENRTFLYTDTGYFGNFPTTENPMGKKLYNRLVINEVQHCTIEDAPPDRWNKLASTDHRLQWNGWKKYDKKILIVAPTSKACKMYGYVLTDWLADTVETLKKYTDMPIEIRHKSTRDDRKKIGSIYSAIDQGVYAIVTFNSIAAIESVLYGVPAFVTVPCAATPLTLSDLSKINEPYFPSKDIITATCNNLAYGQWTLDEFRNGTTWNYIKKKI